MGVPRVFPAPEPTPPGAEQAADALARAIAAEAEAEERLQTDPRNRVDHWFSFTDHPSAAKGVDVVITYPNPHSLPAVATTRLRGANALVIFAAESSGALHKSSEQVIQLIARLVHPPQPESADPDGLRSQLTCRIRQAVSVAIHRGNAVMTTRWINNCFWLWEEPRRWQRIMALKPLWGRLV
ncbi:hypothetical protein DFJ74DRAFT_160142 [Hyaloraphidium curvatum]|nr:hypothetical protein DFJ74DRAFT_160142 [Hyaloraphidium curvatum]